TAELEVQVFGRLPLAISARCYHARAHNLNKGGCQYVCDRDADGLTVDTLDGVPFLVINGLQTMSYTYCNLMKELPEMLGMGINNFRLSPHDVDMVKVTQLYRDCLDGKIESDEASQSLEDEVFAAEFSNGFYHGEPGMEQVEL
ncbi:MAG: U32 family peptidase, partial [Gammaproteobacteria bacterium]|nr:U32 family peptidase [Gammaproteobacteria bacterium]